MIRFRIPLLLFIVLILHSCENFKLPNALFETSARAKYEKEFSKNDSLLLSWQRNYEVAKKSQLKIGESFAAGFNGKKINQNAVAYLMEVKKGDLLVVEIQNLLPEIKIFIDVFQPATGASASESELMQNGKLEYPIENDGWYKVVIQPEIKLKEDFNFRIYTRASLRFPVAGKGNRDAQSFWGASRDGGSRSHEGVDIFAKRGTPVIAATNGLVSRTGNSGLGGKQVWLRDGLLGNSLYYAHLDSIIATGGQRVKAGDTLGLVGNTGNAKGGATHLHFGIYSTGGAVDAYPFIRQRAVPDFDTGSKFTYKMIKSGSNLRNGPGTDFEILKTTTEELPLQILAGNNEWLHIKTQAGLEAFINVGRLK